MIKHTHTHPNKSHGTVDRCEYRLGVFPLEATCSPILVTIFRAICLLCGTNMVHETKTHC